MCGSKGWVMKNAVFSGNKENTLSRSVSIYPNPNNGQFNVEIPSDAVTLVVYDMLGKERMQSTVHSGTFEKINMRDVSNGVYTVILRNADGERLSASKIHVQ